MAVSDRKREANQRNAQKSSGPKRTDFTRLNAFKRGTYAKHLLLRGEDEKAFRQLEKELRADLQPQGAIEEIYFRRALRIEWSIRRSERAERLYLEKTASEARSKSPTEAQTGDDELLSLKPLVDAAYARNVARRTNSKEVVPMPTPDPDINLIGGLIQPADIDRAVLEGVAQAGQGGELSQLRQEQHRLEGDFDRT